ncbi:nicotinate-nucleotide--dimethylbenzimidazole phosphoribosyltransferase [Paracidobacterium acidisoli]|uniref:Nicotinate-nucleotide--dimethylbenzimidazole phosphoribosyltransferase n=1 Tax=Paracidobacterium acidisoli TaxID=2303751 RepID=A0A372IQ89_9BACT|nr:nicotinate-nucleotide--dimethylbenzimidazole phosphoribosyltransferase [Paracidobacterium acidisoli]MBT9331254.1 nicotinate-nucleotide--dimethylbenzimidazole phosphoribosyltransferase [Paracidobacterium acidisoli]
MNASLPHFAADVIAQINAPEEKYREAAQRRLDSLTKPLGSLGVLEALAAQMYAITGGNLSLPLRRAAYVFAADHGVTEEAVSAYPREVTAQMVHNFLQGGAAINVLSKAHRVELTVVDVGVDAVFASAPGLVEAKVRRGSRNLLREPAMNHEELCAALEAGVKLAQSAQAKQQQMIAVGEMGIGNTTAASAITALLTGLPVAEVTGRGAGLDDAGRNAKIDVIGRAIERHFPSSGMKADPLEVLRCVGGLEIAAMTGFILGAARARIAIMLDGFISTSAAAVAYAMAPQMKDYLFAGHCSQEPGHQHLLRQLGLRPILSLDMRLGEGTGAVLAMPVLESSLRLFSEMATFSSAGVSTAAR